MARTKRVQQAHDQAAEVSETGRSLGRAGVNMTAADGHQIAPGQLVQYHQEQDKGRVDAGLIIPLSDNEAAKLAVEQAADEAEQPATAG
jgi:hypothetical protein